MSDFSVVPFPQKLPSKTTEDCNQRNTNTNTEMDMVEVPNYPDNTPEMDTVEVPTLVNDDIEANAVAVNNHENFADFMEYLNTIPPNAMSATMNSNNDATMNSGNGHSSNAEPVSNSVEPALFSDSNGVNDDSDNPENTSEMETVEVPNVVVDDMNAVEVNNHENFADYMEYLNTIPPNAMSAIMNSGNGHSSNAEPVSNRVESALFSDLNDVNDDTDNTPETDTVDDIENTPAYLTLTANVVEVNIQYLRQSPSTTMSVENGHSNNGATMNSGNGHSNCVESALFSDSDDVNMSPPQYESEDVDMLPP
ncbi:MAG: hypothetical protein GY928_02970 [Colwellia sp.]|nr:hypothetical protein [Colwellia sp.]